MRPTFFPAGRRCLWLLLVLVGLAAPGAAGGDVPVPESGARRVVLFEAYELAASLKAWERVVGISRYAYDNDLLQRLLPDLRRIPSPGSGFDVNVEALHALKPDLVVTWSRKPEALEFLQRQGLPVLAIYPENLADLRRDLLLLAAALGRQERGREVAALMDTHLKRLQARVAPLAAKAAPRVVWLWGKPTIISGRRGVVSELLELAGGKNLGGNLDCLNQELSMETLVALDPEVVLIWGSASYGPEQVLQDPKWQTIQAVKSQRVFKASRASTWSPRVVTLAWWMARCFFPDTISEAETLGAMDQFYRECFGIPFKETQ
ncbi:MAG: ABC transporter substrate-binding protein [Desulfobaccales bacterium]